MKAIVCKRFGPIGDLAYQEFNDPVIRPGAAIVRVTAAGVNFPDGLMVQGQYQMTPEFPFVPGTEMMGVVESVGDGVTKVKPGDRVAGYCGIGGYAEKVVMPSVDLSVLPDFVPDLEAAGLTTAHATAHHALKQRAQLRAGETLLVTGASGGTGLAAVQIGKAMGATVIAACSSHVKLDIAQANGADLLINYNDCDLKAELKRVTEGKGVDVAYDVVGGDVFDVLSRSMAWNGRLLVIGFASGRIPELPINLALVKGYSLVGVFWGTFTQKQPDAYEENMSELFNWYATGKIKVEVDQVFPLDEAVEALQKVANREVKGKIVLKI